MTWDQRLQNVIEHHVSRRLAMSIFRWRVKYYVKRGEVVSARVEENDRL